MGELMAKRTKYGKACHRRAFELYRELGSFYAVSKERGMPSHQTLIAWARPGYRCDCGFHGWDALEERIKREVKTRDRQENGQDGQVDGPDLDEYILSDLKKLKINRTIEKKAFDAIAEGIAVEPDTLGEAQKIIHAGWREDRVIRGEPGETIQHIVMGAKEIEKYRQAVYEQVKAELEAEDGDE